MEDDLAKYPLCQLSDLTIAQHFPQLSGLRRIRDCPHFTIPPSSTIEFPPTVIGAHQVLTNTVDCGDDVEQRRSDCELRSMPAVFVEDPHLYFFLGDSLSPSEGIRIAKLFYRYSSQLVGEINTADGERLLRINREGANYSLHIEGCGCAGSIVVAIEDEPGDALLVPVSKYQGVCI